MSLININVTRNFNIPEDEEHKVKFYSNNYHVDFYLMNYFKIFINLHDVDEKKDQCIYIQNQILKNL